MRLRNLVLYLLLAFAGLACESEQQRVCQHLEEQYREWAAGAFDYDPAVHEIDVFYSDTVDACIHAEFAHVGVSAQIRDLSKTVLVDHPHEFPVLMHCDRDWAYYARLDAVRKYGGEVAHVDYENWQEQIDSDEAQTREDCRRIYERTLSVYRD